MINDGRYTTSNSNLHRFAIIGLISPWIGYCWSTGRMNRAEHSREAAAEVSADADANTREGDILYMRCSGYLVSTATSCGMLVLAILGWILLFNSDRDCGYELYMLVAVSFWLTASASCVLLSSFGLSYIRRRCSEEQEEEQLDPAAAQAAAARERAKVRERKVDLELIALGVPAEKFAGMNYKKKQIELELARFRRQQEQRAERGPGDVSRDMVALSVEESDGLVIENVGEVLADDDEGRGRGALAAGDREESGGDDDGDVEQNGPGGDKDERGSDKGDRGGASDDDDDDDDDDNDPTEEEQDDLAMLARHRLASTTLEDELKKT